MTPIVKRIPILVAVAALSLIVAAQVASAQTYVEYTAKFACGVAPTTSPMSPMVQPGTYSTTINIHNPHDGLFSTQPSTTFLKKAVQSLPEGTTQLPPSAFMRDTLENDFAQEVDCTIIKGLLGITSATFIEGYVVIIVPPTPKPTGGFYTNELDVTGIYTNSKGVLEIQPANEHMFVKGTS